LVAKITNIKQQLALKGRDMMNPYRMQPFDVSVIADLFRPFRAMHGCAIRIPRAMPRAMESCAVGAGKPCAPKVQHPSGRGTAPVFGGGHYQIIYQQSALKGRDMMKSYRIQTHDIAISANVVGILEA
jgi:hypothetical protein